MSGAPAAPAVLPNLFLIGAAKSGTSSLHHYLDQHPAVSMSTDKEPHIFAQANWREHLTRYGDLLDAGAPVRGDGSTNYAKYPTFGDVAARIAETVPGARIIYVVREPIGRTVAHYVENVSAGLESRPMLEALQDFDDPRNTYVWTSRYATQIEQYLEHYPRERVLVLDQEDLLSRRAETMRKVFAFLGVDEDFRSDAFDAMLNTRNTKRRISEMGARLQESRAADLARKVPPRWRAPFMRSAFHLFSRQVRRPELDAGLEQRLADLYAAEAERFSALTGLRPAWVDGLLSRAPGPAATR